MGKNLYETPRDKGKWNVQNEGHSKTVNHGANDKKAHLEALKKRFKDQKK